ncbi:glycoside hydrolase family 27 protein [Streptomyces sp. CT34]|uniref:glycoside hydrolase family 27 protein n=1 Tax=Streptomyces sp. CT34 TaxID=1553907 RepID=UPI00068DE4AF|nr:glycoside hydrolase family 27 protein [Streptomyces sp. CT34]
MPDTPPVPLAATPPMGWNSWNTFQCKITEEDVKAAADAMVKSGMRDAGYRYIVLDDGWQAPQRDANGRLQAHHDRFPGGIKALADYVHSKKLKFGIYGTPGTKTCAMIYNGYPGKGLGSHTHEELDAQTWASWGVDLLKYDWCEADKQIPGLTEKTAFTKMKEALKKTGRPILYSISEYGKELPQNGWMYSAGANMWRTTPDISPSWPSISQIIDSQAGLYTYSRPGAWNDPDMLEVGNGMPDDQDRAHFAMWAILNAPLMAGNDLSKMSDVTKRILTNRDVIAVNQNWAGTQGRRLSSTDGRDVWHKPLSDGSIALVLVNRGTGHGEIRFRAKYVGLTGEKFLFRDLWSGETSLKTGDLSFTVAPGSHLMYKAARKSG